MKKQLLVNFFIFCLVLLHSNLAANKWHELMRSEDQHEAFLSLSIKFLKTQSGNLNKELKSRYEDIAKEQNDANGKKNQLDILARALSDSWNLTEKFIKFTGFESIDPNEQENLRTDKKGVINTPLVYAIAFPFRKGSEVSNFWWFIRRILLFNRAIDLKKKSQFKKNLAGSSTVDIEKEWIPLQYAIKHFGTDRFASLVIAQTSINDIDFNEPLDLWFDEFESWKKISSVLSKEFSFLAIELLRKSAYFSEIKAQEIINAVDSEAGKKSIRDFLLILRRDNFAKEKLELVFAKQSGKSASLASTFMTVIDDVYALKDEALDAELKKLNFQFVLDDKQQYERFFERLRNIKSSKKDAPKKTIEMIKKYFRLYPETKRLINEAFSGGRSDLEINLLQYLSHKSFGSEVLKSLNDLNLPFDPNLYSQSQDVPIMEALHYGLYDFITILLEVFKGKIDLKKRKKPLEAGPLHLLARGSFRKFIDDPKEKGSRIYTLDFEQTKKFIEMLLNIGADINEEVKFAYDSSGKYFKTAGGVTVAHFAALGGNPDLIRYLHSKGVDFKALDSAGNNVLHYLCLKGKKNEPELLRLKESFEYLMGNFPTLNINQQNKLGKTPLHYLGELERHREETSSISDSMQAHFTEVTAAMIEKGADQNIKDWSDQTPAEKSLNFINALEKEFTDKKDGYSEEDVEKACKTIQKYIDKHNAKFKEKKQISSKKSEALENVSNSLKLLKKKIKALETTLANVVA